MWIISISNKYQNFTIGTQGPYQWGYIAPGNPDHYFLTKGFYPPPNQTAVSVLEDPSYLGIDSWNPFSSQTNFKHLLQLIEKNIKEAAFYLQLFSPISIVILFLWFVFLFKGFPKSILDEKFLFLLASITLYILGYLLILVESRYFSIIVILLLLMGGKLISKLNWGSPIITILFYSIIHRISSSTVIYSCL